LDGVGGLGGTGGSVMEPAPFGVTVAGRAAPWHGAARNPGL
jgi:hypothetical protein